jgi:hypothetical protein
VNFSAESVDTDHSNISTLSEKLREDGGAMTEGTGGESKPLDAVEPDECEECAKLSDDFPCWF